MFTGNDITSYLRSVANRTKSPLTLPPGGWYDFTAPALRKKVDHRGGNIFAAGRSYCFQSSICHRIRIGRADGRKRFLEPAK